MLADHAAPPVTADHAAPAASGPDLASYDAITVAFSGGKDSLACVLALLEAGVPRERIELWHHDVDGREGSDLMDWPCTRDYCAKVAAALGLRIFYSWREGGIERELLRDNQRTAAVRFETPEGTIGTAGGVDGPLGTRRKFPQVSADLSVRWCSPSVKIDVGAAAIRNQRRFNGRRTLVVSGERAEESPARARYHAFEVDRADPRAAKRKPAAPARGRRRAARPPIRHVDRWRPVLAWTERAVWAIIERWRVNPHPAYRLGWGRVSCMTCIFGSPNQWASVQALAPARFERIAELEAEFGVTIQRKRTVRQLAVVGQPYRWSPEDARAALSAAFDEPAILEPGAWKLPAGAFGESCGPT